MMKILPRSRYFCKYLLIVIPLVIFLYIIVKYIYLSAIWKNFSDEVYECPIPAKAKLNLTGSVEERVRTITECEDISFSSRLENRDDFMVYYNYVKGAKSFQCHESITYTTHGDFTFLDNLEEVVKRWRGPVSITLYGPGSDFLDTVWSIWYLRECGDGKVKNLVTFHVFFDASHRPETVHRYEDLDLNCTTPAPFQTVQSNGTYKVQERLLYPINVARNVAREMAQTHFVLVSDIELYPSLKIIPKFLKMIAKNEGALLCGNPKVFPLHLFEVESNQRVPRTKSELQRMLVDRTVIKFHERVCTMCHNIPRTKEWLAAKETENLEIFNIGKRRGKYSHWEPIYIGTNNDPFYDERLSWEGTFDKMTQGYALCALNYDFMILNNAFLVHRPGIKEYKFDTKRKMLERQNWQIIQDTILPEMKTKYGRKSKCTV